MADDRRAVLTTDQVRAFVDRAPRCKVRIAVHCQPPGLPGAADFVEAQLVDVSRSGMFLSSRNLLAIGTSVDFQFNLDDDVVVLRGSAEVVRLTEEGERGMGLQFTTLDEAGRKLIDRMVETSRHEPPPSAGAGRAPVELAHGSLRIVLSAATAAYFTYNPLLHIGIGGCFIPSAEDVPLGTGYQLDIVDLDGHVLLRCKAKVAAKQEQRLGIRLLDVDRPTLLKLRAEIARLAPAAP